MAITTNILIAAKNLAGNAIVAKLYAGDNKYKQYRVYKQNTDTGLYSERLYTGSVYSKTDKYSEVDISELFSDLTAVAGVAQFRMVLVQANETETDHIDFSIYGGGVSKLALRELGGKDIFSEKLKRNNANFFLTTRTSGRMIHIAEDELLPLYYYAKGLKFNIKAGGEIVKTFNHTADTVESLKSIDFGVLRDELAVTNNAYYSTFDIMTDTSYACTVGIVETKRQSDYKLKFRNSWGVYDMVAMRGWMNYSPEFSEVEKNLVYDSLIRDFWAKANRKSVKHGYTLNSSFKTEDERMLMQDLLLSNDVRLISGQAEYAVNVSVGSDEFISAEKRPVTITLNVELIDEENNYTPMMSENTYQVLGNNAGNVITVGGSQIII